ncbi:MAG: 4Fe-4S dicluster domain-containing protein [bacterium]
MQDLLKKITRTIQSRRSRRETLKYLLLGVGVIFFSLFKWVPTGGRFRFLRPPGALAENDFLRKCIRCGLCGEVCPNQCIRFFSIGSGQNSGSPYIVPREQGCILCMKCNNVCPSGALQPLADDLASIRQHVTMGVAVLDTNLCYSYNDRVCGVCYRACPLQDEALKIGLWETPILVQENCVGCGLCERICYHYPQAIKIIPVEEYRRGRRQAIS